jgi:hypothetical protein
MYKQTNKRNKQQINISKTLLSSCPLDHNIVQKHNNKSKMNNFHFIFDVVITRREIYNE